MIHYWVGHRGIMYSRRDLNPERVILLYLLKYHMPYAFYSYLHLYPFRTYYLSIMNNVFRFAYNPTTQDYRVLFHPCEQPGAVCVPPVHLLVLLCMHAWARQTTWTSYRAPRLGATDELSFKPTSMSAISSILWTCFLRISTMFACFAGFPMAYNAVFFCWAS